MIGWLVSVCRHQTGIVGCGMGMWLQWLMVVIRGFLVKRAWRRDSSRGRLPGLGLGIRAIREVFIPSHHIMDACKAMGEVYGTREQLRLLEDSLRHQSSLLY